MTEYAVVYPYDDETGIALEVPVVHVDSCELIEEEWTVAVLQREVWAAAWLRSSFGAEGVAWKRCPCVAVGPDGIPSELLSLLEAAREATSSTRIDFRDRIAAFGAIAVRAISPWYRDPILASFAVRVTDAVGRKDQVVASAGLQEAVEVAPSPAADDARALLATFANDQRGWPRVAASQRTVAFVGDGPYRVDGLVKSAPAPSLIRPLGTSEFLDTIVIGWEAENLDWCHDSIRQKGRPPRFVPQEGWLALVVMGEDWWLDDPDRINQFADEGHPIDTIREIWPVDFSWPGFEVVSEPKGSGGAGIIVDPESDLRKLGYQISGLSREKRWSILATRCVPELGLERVANHIAFLVRMKRLQPGGDEKFEHAIGEWEHDLLRLKESYYRGNSKFPWPSTIG